MNIVLTEIKLHFKQMKLVHSNNLSSKVGLKSGVDFISNFTYITLSQEKFFLYEYK